MQIKGEMRMLPDPTPIRRRIDILTGKHEELVKRQASLVRQIEDLDAYLGIAGAVSEGLELLSDRLFSEIVETLEESLTAALHEVLGQPVRLRVEKSFKRGAVNMDFFLERDGEVENIMLGTGGSVANILSVGLRFFAISTLDRSKHRRFLVLDEQDCWLRPDLVPRLARIIHLAARTLGFQVLLISHHDVDYFDEYADRVFALRPSPEGVKVQQVK
jgi:hypothetical protein